jgi:hypothetical protein
MAVAFRPGGIVSDQPCALRAMIIMLTWDCAGLRTEREPKASYCGSWMSISRSTTRRAIQRALATYKHVCKSQRKINPPRHRRRQHRPAGAKPRRRDLIDALVRRSNARRQHRLRRRRL